MKIYFLIPMLFFIFYTQACDISDLPKPLLLSYLYEAAKTPNLGKKNVKSITSAEMNELIYSMDGISCEVTPEEATELARKGFIDRLKGRTMKIDLSGDTCDTSGYNQVHGDGKAEQVIEQLRNQLGTPV